MLQLVRSKIINKTISMSILPIANHSEQLESDFSSLLKSLKHRQQQHHRLYDNNCSLVSHRQQLQQNLFINDQIFKNRQLLNQIYEREQQIKIQQSELLNKYEKMTMLIDDVIVFAIKRIVSRMLETTSVIIWNYKDQSEYYVFYYQKFQRKCHKVVDQTHILKPHEVIKLFCKYMRHIMNVQLERLKEIIDCIQNNDFASLQYFKTYFFQVLLKKQLKKKEKFENNNFIVLNNPLEQPILNHHKLTQKGYLDINQSKSNNTINNEQNYRQLQLGSKQKHMEHEHEHKLSIRDILKIHQHHNLHDLHIYSTIHINREQDVRKLHSQVIKSPELIIPIHSSQASIEQNIIQHKKIQSQQPITVIGEEMHTEERTRQKNHKINKRYLAILTDVMKICKDHFIQSTSHENKEWAVQSLLSDLKVRNKGNIALLQKFAQKQRTYHNKILKDDPSAFYIYRQQSYQQPLEQQLIEQPKKQQIFSKPVLISEMPKTQILQKKKVDHTQFEENGSLTRTNVFERKNYMKSIHRSIECKPKAVIHNVEQEIIQKQLYLQKPINIGQSQQINLKNQILHNRPRLPQIITRASSLGNIKCNMNYKVVKMLREHVNQRKNAVQANRQFAQNYDKQIHKDININMIHKLPTPVIERAGKHFEESHHDKIQMKIRQQLKIHQSPDYIQELHKNLTKFCEIKKKILN